MQAYEGCGHSTANIYRMGLTINRGKSVVLKTNASNVFLHGPKLGTERVGNFTYLGSTCINKA
ncbi:hypothetical protein DPMN_004251 [Dreissena polymorpha]|uniref:Uncharacterized protein n=1 Tax=Dreissena polymorpha TaxID=45954 RepID=A0A9D4MN92_DREPO|nr:hypothetical protein DPMN_004251 [Dreissena polymorpha]